MDKQVKEGNGSTNKLYKFSYEEWINRENTLRMSKKYKTWVKDWMEKLWYVKRVV